MVKRTFLYGGVLFYGWDCYQDEWNSTQKRRNSTQIYNNSTQNRRNSTQIHNNST